ncbi:MAG TPA: YncE family protein [Thermoplasmata archaeon]|nr:YncE family protein [Thermoplasmata archaeon]
MTVISGETNSVVTTIPVGQSPGVVAYDNFSGNLYAANVDSDNVSVISGVTNSVITTIPLTCAPFQPTVAGSSVYVLCGGNLSSGLPYYLLVLSATSNKVIATITLDSASYPAAPAYDPGNGLLYLPEVASDRILVISPTTNAVLETIGIGPGTPGATPLTPVYDPATDRLYVPEVNGRNLGVLAGSPGKVVANVSVGFGATNPPVYDSGNGELYLPTLQPTSCAGTCPNDVIVVDPQNDSVVSTIVAGGYPSTPAYDPANGDLYVPNEASNNVTVIFGGNASAPPYTVMFREAGLPPGALWYVTIGTSTRAALAGGTIQFAGLQNGQYAYRTQVFGFASSGSPSSPVFVQGADVGVTVTYVAPTSAPNNLYLTSWELVTILGSLAVAALAAGIVLTVRRGG